MKCKKCDSKMKYKDCKFFYGGRSEEYECQKCGEKQYIRERYPLWGA